MKAIMSNQIIFVEKLAQEETGKCRRGRVRNIVKCIRDWWNHLGEKTLAEIEMENRRNEIRCKCDYYRIRI